MYNQKLMQLFARNRYLYSFLPRTIPDWNNLNIEDLSNCDLDYPLKFISLSVYDFCGIRLN